MTLYVGSNKIKDVSTHGVYVGSQNTNCLTYVPKNINLTLSNGTLTLKAGSKVYVPNGKNADGSLKFDEVVVASDMTLSYTKSSTIQEMIVINASGTGMQHWTTPADCFSGSTAPTQTYALWYDTANNTVKSTINGGSTWGERLSLPIGFVSVGSSGISSIDQIFDWCGYIGSTAFVLPGVKGLRSNGFKADGTYKSIEVETKSVLLNNYTYQATNQQVSFSLNGRDVFRTQNYYSQPTAPSPAIWSIWHNTTDNFNYFIEGDISTGWVKVTGIDFKIVNNISTDSSYRVTSITPATVKPSTTTIPINAIYNGSQLVYQYNSYNPNQVLVNITNGQTATVTLKKGVYQLYAAGGGGSASQWGAGGAVWVRGGCSGGAVEGLFYLSEPKTFVCRAGTPTGGGAGTTPNNTTITINGATAVTCVGGRNGYDSSNGGTGGSASFTNALGSVSCVAKTGLNKGSLGSYNGSASVSAKKWGAGGNAPSGEYTYGGIIIQYIRYEV